MIVDTFGGPGGWDVALAELGRHDVIGVEFDPDACATRAAAGLLTIQADVSAWPLARLAGAEGLIASPPCPSFSAAGKGEGRDELPRLHQAIDRIERSGWVDPWSLHAWSDPRTPLVLQPLRWADALQPDWIALEQVPACLGLWEHFAEVWGRVGYSTWAGVLNAADFGVPQTRRRAILIASRTRPATPPEPTHGRGGGGGTLIVRGVKAVGVDGRDARLGHDAATVHDRPRHIRGRSVAA